MKTQYKIFLGIFLVLSILPFISASNWYVNNTPSENFIINATQSNITYAPLNRTWLNFYCGLSSDSISLPSSTDTSLNHSISIWINYTGSIADNILSYGGGSFNQLYFQSGKAVACVHNTTGDICTTSISYINTSNWVNIISTYNKSTSNLSIYINGTYENSTLVSSPSSGAVNAFLGCTAGDGDRYSLDEFRYYNLALDSNNVTAIFNSRRLANSSLLSTNLTMWFPMNENTNKTINNFGSSTSTFTWTSNNINWSNDSNYVSTLGYPVNVSVVNMTNAYVRWSNGTELLNSLNSTGGNFTGNNTFTFLNYQNIYITDTYSNVNSSINITYPVSNLTYSNTTTIPINVTINQGTFPITTIKLNWNGANYSFISNTTQLFLNLDNNSALGENNSLVVDSSQSAVTGYIYGSAKPCTGKYNGGYCFNGMNDFIASTSALNFNDTNGFTIGAWIYKNNSQGGTIFYDSNGGVDRGMYLNIQNGVITFDIAATTNMIVQSTDNLNNNTWYYITATWDGTIGSTSHAHIYINGAEVTNYLTGQTGVGTHNNPNNIYWIGYGSTGSYYYWNGSIDEVRVWNRTLTPSDVLVQYSSNLQHYNSTTWYLTSNLIGIKPSTNTFTSYVLDNQGYISNSNILNSYIGQNNLVINYNYSEMSQNNNYLVPGTSAIQGGVIGLIVNFFTLMPTLGTILAVCILIGAIVLLVMYVKRMKEDKGGSDTIIG